MCLMCEYYVSLCEEPECIASAHEDDIWKFRNGDVARLNRGTEYDCPHN